MKNWWTVILIVVPFWLRGQEFSVTEATRFSIGVVPQYAITNGIRMDLDFRLSEKGQWLVAGPQVYLNSGTSNIWEYERMSGVGIDLQHRMYLKGLSFPQGAYFAYGPVFQHFSVRDKGLTTYDFQENNANYIGLAEASRLTRITKLGGNLIFGYQLVIDGYLYFDFYIGTGIRFSYDDRTSGLHENYNEWWGDLGYSGTLMVAGIRFGITR